MQDIKKNIPKSITLRPLGQIRTMSDDMKEAQSPEDRANLSSNIFSAKEESIKINNEIKNSSSVDGIGGTKIPFIESGEEEPAKVEINNLLNKDELQLTEDKLATDLPKSDFQLNLSSNIEEPQEEKIDHRKELEEKSKELFAKKDNNSLGNSLVFPKDEVPFSKKDSLDNNPLFKEMSMGDASNEVNNNANPIPTYDNNLPKKSNKMVYYIIGSVLVVLLIGGGIAFFLLGNRDIDNNQSNLDTQNTDEVLDDTTEETDTEDDTTVDKPIDEESDIDSGMDSDSLFSGVSMVPVTVKSTSIRSDIIAKVSGLQEEVIYLDLKNEAGTKISLREFASYMGITIPESILSGNSNWWTYAYKEQGLYKIANVLEMNNNATESFIEEWKPAISRNMSGYSLNSSSRGISATDPSKTTVNTSNGKQVSIYYYNYTTPSNAIDIGYIKDDKYIFMSSSKFSMEALIKSFEKK